jgi:hypothetical protein
LSIGATIRACRLRDRFFESELYNRLQLKGIDAVTKLDPQAVTVS